MKLPKKLERITAKGSHFIAQIGFDDENKTIYVEVVGGQWYGYEFKTKAFYLSIKTVLSNCSAKVKGSVYGGVISNSKFAEYITPLQ